ncbi:MAG: 50S ribosomal protein L21 [Acidobacteria bacterium]|nr:50S ribosomal protein L21 [Acidobacteriota bacterium]MCY4075229.1 50S ribosomal protein L21 [Acidobacteriota bacterium]
MYAIIESGGRQVRVEEGAVIHVDRLDAQIGDEVEFNRVLFVEQSGSFVAGTPYVNGASVSGLVDAQTRGPKIRVFRKRRRKAWRRTLGHRAELTSVRIVRIDA